MESYIPLIKAIIISTMFSWGTSSVVITDQYIYRENIRVGQFDGSEYKSYWIYEIKTNLVHVVSEKMDSQSVIPLSDAFRLFYPWSMHPQKGYVPKREIDTTIVKKDYSGFLCKKETRKTKYSTVQYEVGQTVISYFAKIPWLDDFLDSEDKRKFTGFERQEYSPYHYLVYEFIQYPNQEPKDKVLRIIEKSEVDTTLIHTLLSLPLKN